MLLCGLIQDLLIKRLRLPIGLSQCLFSSLFASLKELGCGIRSLISVLHGYLHCLILAWLIVPLVLRCVRDFLAVGFN